MAFRLFDVVTATEAIPEAGVRIGMVGVIVEVFADGEYEVEFCNDEGEPLVMMALRPSQLAPVNEQPE